MALVNESDQPQFTESPSYGRCCLRLAFFSSLNFQPARGLLLPFAPLPDIPQAYWIPSAVSASRDAAREQRAFQHLMHHAALTVVQTQDGRHQPCRLLSQGSLWKPLWLLVVGVNCSDVLKSVSPVTRTLLCQDDRWTASSSSALPTSCDVSAIYLSGAGIFVAPDSTWALTGNSWKILCSVPWKICSVACCWPTAKQCGAFGNLVSATHYGWLRQEGDTCWQESNRPATTSHWAGHKQHLRHLVSMFGLHLLFFGGKSSMCVIKKAHWVLSFFV